MQIMRYRKPALDIECKKVLSLVSPQLWHRRHQTLLRTFFMALFKQLLQ